MAEVGSNVLVPWANFYIMAGSSAAGLTGLMFVVITLVTREIRSDPQSEDGIAAFSTPTVVHFGAALLISAALSAPWPKLLYPGILLAVVGLSGVVYILRLAILARRLTTYSPDRQDWVWYTIMPTLAYAAILVGALYLFRVPADAMFAFGGGVMLLIFIGVRNAWDIVTYLAIKRDQP